MGNFFSRKKKPLEYASEVELAHFKLLRSIGKGAFGKVRVVEKRDTKKLFALKYINKAKCVRQRAVHNTLRERFILQEIHHPFVVNLRYAFQDDENMFVVLDLMTGGSLRYHLDRLRSLSEAQVQFIGAEVIVALQYLHSKRIVHRDIKPDNILIDDLGHMHLTDFNIAARLEEGKYLTSQSGTLSYMAPEMFTKKGYGTAVDYWALGVVLFECVYGYLPFRQETEEAVIKEISTSPIVFKPHGPGEKKTPVGPDCISCLESLLSRDKHQRLGCTSRGIQEVQAHPFFASLRLAELHKKEIVAPFVPDAKSMNFDPTHELEELLLEENPLMVKPRKRKTKRLLADFSRCDSRPATAPGQLPSPTAAAAPSCALTAGAAKATGAAAMGSAPSLNNPTPNTPVTAAAAALEKAPSSGDATEKPPTEVSSTTPATTSPAKRTSAIAVTSPTAEKGPSEGAAGEKDATGARTVKGALPALQPVPAGNLSRAHSVASAVDPNKGKKAKKEEEPLSAEMQLIEDAFIPFDYEKREIYLHIAEAIVAECGNAFPSNVSTELNAMIAREKAACAKEHEAQLAAEAAAASAASDAQTAAAAAAVTATAAKTSENANDGDKKEKEGEKETAPLASPDVEQPESMARRQDSPLQKQIDAEAIEEGGVGTPHSAQLSEI